MSYDSPMISKFFSRVEKLFDNPAFELNLIEQKKYFEINPDNSYLENISYIFSNKETDHNLATIFTRFTCFFEMGFLFQKNTLNQKSCLISCFGFGVINQDISKRIEFQLPQTTFFSVHKTSAQGFLKKMGLNQIDREKRFEAYYIRLSNNSSIVVMSAWPKPWLKPRLESLQKTLMRLPFTEL